MYLQTYLMKKERTWATWWTGLTFAVRILYADHVEVAQTTVTSQHEWSLQRVEYVGLRFRCQR